MWLASMALLHATERSAMERASEREVPAPTAPRTRGDKALEVLLAEYDQRIDSTWAAPNWYFNRDVPGELAKIAPDAAIKGVVCASEVCRLHVSVTRPLPGDEAFVLFSLLRTPSTSVLVRSTGNDGRTLSIYLVNAPGAATSRS